MGTLPPFGDPSALSYCQLVMHPSAIIETDPSGYTTANWFLPGLTEDTLFCQNWTGELWRLMLYLALLLWAFLTATEILASFRLQEWAGFRLSEVAKVVGRQLAILLAACCSFALLLLAHQVLWAGINAVLGLQHPDINCYPVSTSRTAVCTTPDNTWRVADLWGRLHTLIDTSQTTANQMDPNAGLSSPFGGNLPDDSGPFGLTWGQIFGGLGSLETFVDSTIQPIRFVALFVAVVTAPLGILAYSSPVTRRFCFIWLEMWVEIEALALGTALVIACYQEMHGYLDASGTTLSERAYILLGLTGLACGANLAFLWKIIGQFLTQISGWYQQQYQRHRQLVGIGVQAAVGVVGLVATIATDGLALPFVVAAEGLVSGAEELGAPPGGATPGAGTARSLIGAGEAGVRYQHQQAQIARQQQQDAERAADRQESQQHQQAQAARQQQQDAERAAHQHVQEQRYQAAQAERAADRGLREQRDQALQQQRGAAAYAAQTRQGEQVATAAQRQNGRGPFNQILPVAALRAYPDDRPTGGQGGGGGERSPKPDGQGPTRGGSGTTRLPPESSSRSAGRPSNQGAAMSPPSQGAGAPPTLPPTGSLRQSPPRYTQWLQRPSSVWGPGENPHIPIPPRIRQISAKFVDLGHLRQVQPEQLERHLMALEHRHQAKISDTHYNRLARYLEDTRHTRTQWLDNGYQKFLALIDTL